MAADAATSVCLQFPSSPDITHKLYKALCCNAHTFPILRCWYATVILVGVGGGGVFTPQILCCSELFCYCAQAHYPLQKTKLAGRICEAEKFFCCVGLVIKQGLLNHSIAPQLVNNFSHCGDYMLLVAVLGFSVSLPLWSSTSIIFPLLLLLPVPDVLWCSFNSRACDPSGDGHLETKVFLLELPSSSTEGTEGLWFLPAPRHSGFALWATALDSSLSHRILRFHTEFFEQ